MAGCQAGVARVQGEILGHWPGSTYNAGCYNPHSRLDSGGPSAHALGEACDIGIVQRYRGRGSIGQVIFLFLYNNRGRLGLHQLIYDRQIWSESHGSSIRPYSTNPHYDHIHVHFNPGPARNPNLTAHPFSGVPAAAERPKPKSEEEEVFRIIKGDKFQDRWLTNWLEKRKIGSAPGHDGHAEEQVKAIIAAGVTNGAGVVTWPQPWVDQIPTVR